MLGVRLHRQRGALAVQPCVRRSTESLTVVYRLLL